MSRHDVIVVGARCAGSPTAMLLARRGYRVLVVDRATFPSDTLSTHVIQPHGCAALARWGLLERVVATGCPPVHTYTYDFGDVVLAGAPGTAESPVAYAPRRTVLDKILVDAAAAAGAEIREAFSVDEILIEDGRVVGVKGHAPRGPTVTEEAPIVIGADGRHSLVARAVEPETYNEKPPLQAGYYTYFSDLPVPGRFEFFARGDRGFAAIETNDGLTMVVGGWPMAQHEENKKDFEGSFHRMFDRAPSFAERLRGARRVDRLYGAFTPNFFRKPFGPGWVLVGDAGYNKDPITAQGITDAFLDAEQVAAALDRALGGATSFDDAMAGYQQARDQRVLPMYEFTTQLASFEPPPPEMQELFAAMAGNQAAMDRFAQVNAGTLSPAEFFTPESIGAIMAAAQAPRGAAGAS
jgi:2-polyprenyl-6-methoxyphenol hydroxylase-like FAD-dependent oxidoreductase